MPDQQVSADKAIHKLTRLVCDKLDPSLISAGASKINEFLAQVGSSAPRITDATGRLLLRWQDKLIEAEITEGASVLDLGCGNGELLSNLMRLKRVRGQGVELEIEAVFQCVERGVPVFQADLDDGLKGFANCRFDYVILEETLQTLHRPIDALQELLRVGRRAIVSFPNFAYWRVRLDLALRGRMPVTEYLPYRWYDTPNIHLCTLQDFLDWIEAHKVLLIKGYVLAEGKIRPLQPDDNLYAEEALLILQRV
ncbi:MAG: methionine biosynthesis protein MetW [Planctomycetota bacterium]